MRALVADASALVEYLLGTPEAQTFAPILTDPNADLHVPALCDVEITSALRRAIQRRLVTLERAQEALQDYSDLPLTRHGHQGLIHRCLELRDVLSAYDATYVALAEGLRADLVTADRRLARGAESVGVSCR